MSAAQAQGEVDFPKVPDEYSWAVKKTGDGVYHVELKRDAKLTRQVLKPTRGALGAWWQMVLDNLGFEVYETAEYDGKVVVTSRQIRLSMPPILSANDIRITAAGLWNEHLDVLDAENAERKYVGDYE